MSEQYDNTNKGGLWPAKAGKGTVDVGGAKYYMVAVATGATGERAPCHEITLKSAAPDGLKYEGVVFRPDKAEHGLASGKITVAGFDYYVNLYKNTNGAENSPMVDVKFKLKAAAEPAAAAAEGQPQGDDIPF